jgi:hypothetical protein
MAKVSNRMILQINAAKLRKWGLSWDLEQKSQVHGICLDLEWVFDLKVPEKIEYKEYKFLE